MKPSDGSKHLLLERLSAGRLGSSLIDSPVDVRLHPIDPVELRLMINYLQKVSDAEKTAE